MPSKTIEDFAYQVRDYMRSAEVVEGKNHAYSQENNAVIATIENGKSYKVRWTGSATVTLKKNSASGTEVTSGSTSPLSFTADSDFVLYFGSSADVTEIMVYDGASTSDTYEPYYVPVKDRVDELDDDKLDASALAPIENGSTASQAYNVGDYLIRDNELYTAAINIAMGDSLVVDTNITKSTLNRILMGSIVANSDLDNYYRSGRYCCGSSSAAQSLTHKPSDISAGFVMDVYNGPFLRSGQAVQMTTQIIMCVNTAIPAIYMRQKAYSGSFSDWYKFTGTVV